MVKKIKLSQDVLDATHEITKKDPLDCKPKRHTFRIKKLTGNMMGPLSNTADSTAEAELFCFDGLDYKYVHRAHARIYHALKLYTPRSYAPP